MYACELSRFSAFCETHADCMHVNAGTVLIVTLLYEPFQNAPASGK